MNKVANVIFAYVPKNDDELELKVGDRIEVIGEDEEGWWKGKLKGRIGVFPTNFVQVLESNSPPSSRSATSTNSNNNNINNNNNITPSSITANKLSSIFGNKITKSSTTNSLNNNNSNNNYTTSNTMNNTQQQQQQQHDMSHGLPTNNEDPSLSVNSSEKRPKPIRGVGYGDLFAVSGVNLTLAGKTKPLPADPIATGSLASERLSVNNILASTMQKQIPKKPPPPAPVSESEQAPALPPKPANHFSPHLQQLSRATIQQQQQHHQQPQMREQAKAIYAYEPSNDDELAMEVGDIIDIIDKDIEDAGWWKGELRGKIGVFPDNFVQLIVVPDVPNLDWHSRQSNTSNTSTTTTTSQPLTPHFNQTIETKVKPVFATTPKEFSKELENNILEKQQHNISNNPAALLSLKRNKIQHSSSLSSSTIDSNMSNENGKDLVIANITESPGTTKLNHITANRAKGPTRRPPSNILSKRNQTDSTNKKETNGKDDSYLNSLPLSSTVTSGSQMQTNLANNHDSLSSLPAVNQPQKHSNQPVATNSSNLFNAINKQNDAAVINQATGNIKSSLSLDNVVENIQQAPKTSQRLFQANSLVDKSNKTPSWMVELKKAQAEKKRDSPAITAPQQTATATTSIISNAPSTNSSPIVTSVASSISTSNSFTTNTNATTEVGTNVTTNTNSIQSVIPPPTVSAPSIVNSQELEEPVTKAPELSKAHYDSLLKQISKNVNYELNELKEEVKRLKSDFMDLSDIKNAMEVMRAEIKACQSATENQKRYIKELVNNLADERKKIASMQDEIDRNLK